MSTPHLEPKQLDVPQVLARDWINRHGTFRTVSTGGQRERTGTDWGMVITEAGPAQVADAVRKLSPYWDQWARERGPEAIEALQKVRAELRK